MGYVITAVNVVLAGLEVVGGFAIAATGTPIGIIAEVTLAANAYNIFGLLRRPGTWRLFHYLPTDFYRKVETMKRPMLTMKIVGYGLKAKVVFDLMTSRTEPAH